MLAIKELKEDAPEGTQGEDAESNGGEDQALEAHIAKRRTKCTQDAAKEDDDEDGGDVGSSSSQRLDGPTLSDFVKDPRQSSIDLAQNPSDVGQHPKENEPDQ
ncbi:unnamed protein product [Calypogeia fissa]